ncbi:MAG: hypothetical protein ACI9FJ_002440 [Alteromonadaceae bacterium]|jgi:hypothetical protein
MDTTKHDFSTLFAQLGLDNDSQSISKFIDCHKLAHDLSITDAPFWSTSQKAFITESLAEDGDWSEMIDLLSSLLR